MRGEEEVQGAWEDGSARVLWPGSPAATVARGGVTFGRRGSCSHGNGGADLRKGRRRELDIEGEEREGRGERRAAGLAARGRRGGGGV